MSQFLIQQYLNDLSDLRRASGTTREGVVSEAFKDLLKGYAKSHDLIFIPQYELSKQDGRPRWVDGALVYDLRVRKAGLLLSDRFAVAVNHGVDSGAELF